MTYRTVSPEKKSLTRAQRGFAFLPFLLANWQLIGIVLLALAGFAYFKHCEFIKLRHESLIAKLEAQAEAARQDTERKIQEGRKAKERADEDHKRTVARLNRDIERLRKRTAGSVLPAPAPGSPSPERIAFDRGELDRALRAFIDGTTGIVAEGDAAVGGLDAAKRWAQ